MVASVAVCRSSIHLVLWPIRICVLTLLTESVALSVVAEIALGDMLLVSRSPHSSADVKGTVQRDLRGV
jgi:hypothetical protein